MVEAGQHGTSTAGEQGRRRDGAEAARGLAQEVAPRQRGGAEATAVVAMTHRRTLRRERCLAGTKAEARIRARR
jgi:hypothetical protein